MKRHYNRPAAITVFAALLWAAAADEALAQKPANGAAKLVVTVTVPPICTVAVTPGEWSAQDAIEVQCRNLPADHPQPVVSDAVAVADAAPDVSGNSTAPANQVATVVINF